jgi:hypothetical protein
LPKSVLDLVEMTTSSLDFFIKSNAVQFTSMYLATRLL